MIRLRTLIATALLTIPMLALSAPARTSETRGAASHVVGSAPPVCVLMGGRLVCF
jgi:hypothetical protein